MSADDDFISTFDKIKCKHDEAFHLVDDAIKQEEEDHPHHALNLYKMAVEAIDETLAIPVKVPENMEVVRSEWDNACRMIHKIKRARAELVQRIGVLSEKQNAAGNATSVTSTNTSATNDTLESRPRTYSELAQALRDMKCTGEGIESLELLFSCEGVKLYYIKPNGLVTTALVTFTSYMIGNRQDKLVFLLISGRLRPTNRTHGKRREETSECNVFHTNYQNL